MRDWNFGGDGRVPFVAEPELEGRFSGWNNNVVVLVVDHSQGIIEEGDEDEESDEDYEPAGR